MLNSTIPTELRRLAEIFYESGARLYAVGGMVRNALCGLKVNDMDICSSLSIEAAEKMLTERGIPCRKKGVSFGTLDIMLEGKTFEYASFRTESYDISGHCPTRVRFGATLEEDAFRRDFTINAIYLDPITLELIDPTGGIKDIFSKTVRATSADPTYIMKDDGVRILRLARFCGQLGFTADPATVDAAYSSRAGLNAIAAERLYSELCSILLSDIKYFSGRDSLLYALHTLDKSGAIEQLFPELKKCDGILQRKDFHKYDVMEHCLRACVAIDPLLELRWTMLLHDTGKASAFFDHGSMHGHEMYSAKIADSVLKRLKAPNLFREEVVRLVRWHMFDLKGETRIRKIKKMFVYLGREGAQKLISIREADVHGSGIVLGRVDTAERWKNTLDGMIACGAPFTEGELNCTGKDICRWLDIQPSARVGEVKRALLMHCACKSEDNTSERLELITKKIGRGNKKL